MQESPDLEKEMETVNGQLRKDAAKLDAISRVLERSEKLAEPDRRKKESEHTELKESIKNFKKELESLNIKKEGLTIRSPIDGRVVTSNVQEHLGASRPVNRGEKLLEIADAIDYLNRDALAGTIAVPNIEQVKTAEQHNVVPLPKKDVASSITACSANSRTGSKRAKTIRPRHSHCRS